MRPGRQEERNLRARPGGRGAATCIGTNDSEGSEGVFREGGGTRRDRSRSALALGQHAAQEAWTSGDGGQSAAGEVDLREQQQDRPARCGAFGAAGTGGSKASGSG